LHLTFLTPLGGLLALTAVFPLAALLVGETRAGRARLALRLEPPPRRVYASTALALALVPVLLGLALAQPVLRSEEKQRVRSDAQIFYVFDISNSMRASHGPRSPTRLQRALQVARRMRLDLADVPSGVATMTDRVLPNIYPTGDEQLFAAALAETVGVERPPAKGFEDRATTFAALDTFAGDNFFSSGIKHRLVVLLTDGESAPYFGGDLRESLRLPPRTAFVIIRMGGQSERIWVNGRLDPRYRPDPNAAHATAGLAAVVDGRPFREGQVGPATAAAKRFLGTGPLTGVGHGLRAFALAPWLALASLIPLFFLLWTRNALR
jgi:hypothetical protein